MQTDWVVWSSLAGVAFGTLVGLPVAPFYLALGVALGVLGLPLVALALIVSFSVSYWLASGPARALLQRLLKKRPLPDVAEVGALRFIVLVRVMPGIPLSVQNYLLGLLRVGFGKNLWVSLPIQLLWAAGFMLLGESFMRSAWISFALGVVAILLLSLLLKNYARRIRR